MVNLIDWICTAREQIDKKTNSNFFSRCLDIQMQNLMVDEVSPLEDALQATVS
jgi:predicted RNA-binding protein YlxR (DUF448 family)